MQLQHGDWDEPILSSVFAAVQGFHFSHDTSQHYYDGFPLAQVSMVSEDGWVLFLSNICSTGRGICLLSLCGYMYD